MTSSTPLTYADSGVDIDAGNAMVDQIKPMVRATRRPGADAEIGGFGGLFDLKAAGFKDPILVAANDGVDLSLARQGGSEQVLSLRVIGFGLNGSPVLRKRLIQTPFPVQRGPEVSVGFGVVRIQFQGLLKLVDCFVQPTL